jgi:type I restriction enzyme S subunit
MKNWELVRLGDVCNLINGRAYKKAELLHEGKYSVLRVGNFFSNRSWYYSDLELDDSKYCDNGDLLYAWSASFGPRIWKGGKVIYHYHIWKTNLNLDKVDKKYLYYWFEWDTERIKAEQGVGTTMIHVTKEAMENRSLYLPAISEQKRIVAILDEAFEGIDRAIANTEKNLTNSRELFESYLNAIFTQKGDGWVEKKLGEIGGKVFTGPFGSLLHKSDYVSNEIPIVNPANIEDDKIIPNFNKTVSQDIVKRLQAYILKQNDVVVGRRGEIGRCAVVREEQAGWLCGSGSFFIKPFENVDSVFLAHLLRSAVYRNKLESLATGATMQNLSNQSLSALVIAMPSLDEQNRITNKIDDLRTETQRLETIYCKKIAALNELKQSILQKAFTGELTADTANQTIKAAQEVNAA